MTPDPVMTTAPAMSLIDELLTDIKASHAKPYQFTNNQLSREAYSAYLVIQSLLAERADLKRQLAEAQEGAGMMRMLALLCDIRTACGDDGKRMQPELVEYIGELKRDAERLDFMDAPHPSRTIGSHDGRTLITISTTPGRTFSTARAAIDNAMEATK